MRRPTQLADNHVFNIPDSRLFEEAAKKFLIEFFISYEQTVIDTFSDLYEEFPEVFPCVRKARDCVIVFNNTDIQFNIFQGKAMSITCVHNQYKTYGDYKKNQPSNDVERLQKRINLIGRDDAPLLQFTISYGFEGPTLDGSPGNSSRDPEDLPEMGKIKGRQIVFEQGNKIENRFSLFEFQKYVLKVDDQHFYYEIGEAIEAYKHGLYLAATAVAGVSLENILKIIISRKIPNSKLRDIPYIKECLDELVKHGLMEDRKKRDIMNFNNTRNGSAHSNSGKVLAKHAEEGFTIIKHLIDDYL